MNYRNNSGQAVFAIPSQGRIFNRCTSTSLQGDIRKSILILLVVMVTYVPTRHHGIPSSFKLAPIQPIPREKVCAIQTAKGFHSVCHNYCKWIHRTPTFASLFILFFDMERQSWKVMHAIGLTFRSDRRIVTKSSNFLRRFGLDR